MVLTVADACELLIFAGSTLYEIFGAQAWLSLLVGYFNAGGVQQYTTCHKNQGVSNTSERSDEQGREHLWYDLRQLYSD